MTFFWDPDLLVNFRFAVVLMAKARSINTPRHGQKSHSVPIPLTLRFQKVSGLTVKLEEETLTYGGDNIGNKTAGFLELAYDNLILERGIFLESPLNVMETLSDLIQFLNRRPRMVVLVSVLSDIYIPQRNWLFNNAYPVRWSTADLDAENPAVLIETLEMRFKNMTALTL